MRAAWLVGAVVAGEIAAHCDADHWNAVLVGGCLATYKTVDDGNRCEAMLTPAQRAALETPSPP